MFRLVKKHKKTITLKDHYERRNRILIKRRAGGFGDILMQRMLFNDFQKYQFELHYTCPIHYLEMAKYYPNVAAHDINGLDETQFGAVYDITTPCRVHEAIQGINNQDHRADIWAAHCGIQLTSHEMHLTSQPDMLLTCQKGLNYHNPENKPIVLLATHSTTDDFGVGKTLTDNQITDIVYQLKQLGYLPINVHSQKLDIFDQLGVQQFYSIHPQAWIAIVSLVDYIISVDTGTFHLAGGLKKPLVGVFTYTNGKVYGKYYDFILVQKHRDNGNWDCGPCFNCGLCPKEPTLWQKPCLTELTSAEIMQGFLEATKKWPVQKNEQKIP